MHLTLNLWEFIGIFIIFVIQMRNRHEKNTLPIPDACPAALGRLQRPQAVDRCLASCRGTDERYPDSAWAVLNALSPDEMGQSRTRAHYALLYT